MSITPRVILIPGNGNSSVNDNWFPCVKSELEAQGLRVTAEEFPDRDWARESFWIPFLENELHADDHSILVGHSSGAVAAMRYAETHMILGSVLVGAYHTDLGSSKEQSSGYFNRPWNFEAIKRHQQWICLFSSTDDPWIPIEEPRYLHQQLGCDYFEFHDRGHFGGDRYVPKFPELVDQILKYTRPVSFSGKLETSEALCP